MMSNLLLKRLSEIVVFLSDHLLNFDYLQRNETKEKKRFKNEQLVKMVVLMMLSYSIV